MVAVALVFFAQSYALGQRDDADSNPSESRAGAEPPRLRGGFMQQLRSVTETVLGSPADKHLSQEQNRRVPKPPPL